MRFFFLVTLSTVALTQFACGSTPATTSSAAATPEAAAPVDQAAIKRKVSALMDQQRAAIGKPDIAAFAAFLDPDVVWYGASAGEAMVGRDAVAADLEQGFGPLIAAKASFDPQSGGISVGVAPDGRAAWTAEEITLVINAGGEPIVIPYRISSILAEAGGKWSVIAQCWSVGVPNEQAFELAAKGQWPALRPIGAAVAPGAESLERTFGANVADAAGWVAAYSDSADAFVFGSAPSEKYSGGPAIKAAFGAMVQEYQVQHRAVGGVRVGLAPSGSLGFVATNLDFTVHAEGNAVTQPYRALVAYIMDRDAWRPVQAHFSNGPAQE